MQYQFCNAALPSEKSCGPLASWVDAQVQTAPLFDSAFEALENNESPPSNSPTASRYIGLVALLSLASIVSTPCKADL